MNVVEPLIETGMPTSDDLFLGGILTIRQPLRGYRAGTDAVLLAASVRAHSRAAGPVLDAGSGVGVVGLCVAARCPEANVTLVERDPALASLARYNTDRNGLTGRVTIVEADITRATPALQSANIASESYALVLANPPYHDERRSTAAENPLRAASHQMPEDTLDAWARFLCRMALPGGRVALIHKADALPSILTAFEGRFGGIGILPIYARAGEPAIRVIVDGIKGSRAPAHVKAGLTLHGPDQAFVPEIEAVFRDGAPLPL
ncbi:methyltransferase [Hyphomicrobium methylovorum]|uniref:tRNA1(Val) (adenine(37)-N6)-methyltransferase n=1 Tax=Hyphomicrobium methylovorum TaxID=84 RepID=UPI0015E6B1FF|nr:methyltransferase [Hyphomicrobium methylovorum]MBA2125800.1 methyltransferase [Hyphomicrobium methylovorum]